MTGLRRGSRRPFILGCFSALTLLAAPLAAQAQSYPDKPIRLIVPYSAGGGADNAARVLSQAMGAELGQSVIIENRAGASGAIGAAVVAQAPKDGYTVLYDASTFAVNPVLRKLPFDALNDLVPVSQAISVPNIMVVAENSPYKTFADFMAAAKQSPGKLTYASYGPGSAAHLIGELLKKEAGIDILHVPYKGGAPALVDVMGGQVNTYFANAASSLNYVKQGKLRALAVTSAKRMSDLPDVPTIAESGFPNFEVLEWNGFFVPKGTPDAVVQRLNAAVLAVLKKDDVRQRLLALGLNPAGTSPAEFKAFVASEMTRWGELVKTNHITVE
jgi:tripartite-type tricarboxylate transporter receptor subunit TctC